jgi:hypothetical protein
VEKPKLRGVLHQFAAVGALGAGGVLVSMAPTPRAAAAAALYAVSLVVPPNFLITEYFPKRLPDKSINKIFLGNPLPGRF